MSWVAGIDFSTRAVDVVLVDEDGEMPVRWHSFPLVGKDAWARTRDLTRTHLGLPWDDIRMVGIEEPAGRLTGRLFRVQGVVLARIPDQISVMRFMPSEWRKDAGLAGNASKRDVAEFVARELRDRSVRFGWTQDACDAYCIAVATLRHLERTEEEAA